MWGEFTFWHTRDSSQYCDSGPSMSNCPLSGQQAMLRPQWRGDPSQAAAFPYLARLQNVSAQKAYAENLMSALAFNLYLHVNGESLRNLASSGLGDS